MPQGSFLGPLTFLILINDLLAGCNVHKFVDDTTLTECIRQPSDSNMCHFITEVLKWSADNNMNINWTKTKEMIIGSAANSQIPPLIVDGHQISRVNMYKLLGVCVNSDLKWDNHVNAICSKASSRLYFLKLLKRCSVSKDDLLHFYTSFIRPVLEYACPAWHSSLTSDQRKRIENVQRRALLIIYGDIDYFYLCTSVKLDSLFNRRESLCRSFFESMLCADNCLHYLLPAPRSLDNISRLRTAKMYIPPTAKTSRYQKSFIPYALDNYQIPVPSVCT